jgi:hypothetical protein
MDPSYHQCSTIVVLATFVIWFQTQTNRYTSSFKLYLLFLHKLNWIEVVNQLARLFQAASRNTSQATYQVHHEPRSTSPAQRNS